mmetsp:Transcript_32934/g.80053  ORF Transcript_32934/g.80053 Transcript_32934/m.80053 type:complete len:301 (+) Transcript_32934:3410-4312(+)
MAAFVKTCSWSRANSQLPSPSVKPARAPSALAERVRIMAWQPCTSPINCDFEKTPSSFSRYRSPSCRQPELKKRSDMKRCQSSSSCKCSGTRCLSCNSSSILIARLSCAVVNIWDSAATSSCGSSIGMKSDCPASNGCRSGADEATSSAESPVSPACWSSRKVFPRSRGSKPSAETEDASVAAAAASSLARSLARRCPFVNATSPFIEESRECDCPMSCSSPMSVTPEGCRDSISRAASLLQDENTSDSSMRRCRFDAAMVGRESACREETGSPQYSRKMSASLEVIFRSGMSSPVSCDR